MRQSKSQHMVRPTPESHFVTKQRNAQTTKLAKQLSKGIGTRQDVEKLARLVERGGKILMGNKQLTYAEVTDIFYRKQREAGADDDKRRHQHGKD